MGVEKLENNEWLESYGVCITFLIRIDHFGALVRRGPCGSDFSYFS